MRGEQSNPDQYARRAWAAAAAGGILIGLGAWQATKIDLQHQPAVETSNNRTDTVYVIDGPATAEQPPLVLIAECVAEQPDMCVQP